MTVRARYLLVVSGVFLLCALLMCVGAWYVLSMSEKQMREDLRVRDERAQREREYANIRKLYDESREQRTALQEYVIKEERVADFLELLEKSAKEQGLTPKITSVDIEKLPDVTTYEALSLNMQVAGSHDAVLRFLPILESLPYQAEVRSVSLDRDTSGEAGDNEWRGLFQLRVTKELSS